LTFFSLSTIIPSMNVYAYSDFFVRYLLGDEKNSDLLLSFINSVHEDYNLPQLKSVIIKNPFNLKNLADEKESVIDIKAEDESGRQYDIEVQVEGSSQYVNRSLYYWARLYHSQINIGDDYKKLNPTICINLINFKLFKDYDAVHSCFVLKEKRHPELELSNHLLIHFIELDKFVKDSNFMLSFEKWLAFFRYEGFREEIMEQIIKDDPILTKAHARYSEFTRNDRLMEIYYARMKQQADEKTRLSDAKTEGKIEGKIEGKMETAKALLNDGIPAIKVSKYTGLSIDIVEKLVKE